MLPLETAIAFFGVSLGLALAPGPDNLFVLAQSALHGARSGATVTLGLCTGLLVHTAAVALGVAALLRAWPLAFGMLRAVGVAYLAFLAWQAFRAAAIAMEDGAEAELSSAQLYRRGVWMNLSNPKVSIFFLALLPQFTDPASGPLLLQVLALGVLFIAATLLVFNAIAWGSRPIGAWLRGSEARRRAANLATGLLFLALAGGLAFGGV